MAAAVTAHPAVAAVGRGGAPEGLVLGLIAPRATVDGPGLDSDEGGQQGADENDGGVHACRGLVGGWGFYRRLVAAGIGRGKMEWEGARERI